MNVKQNTLFIEIFVSIDEKSVGWKSLYSQWKLITSF